MKRVTIGVLGGIGPEATSTYYARLVKTLQESGLIRRNEDFPRIVINSIPAPELTGRVTKALLAPYQAGIQQLNREKPDFIVMVCNTIHAYRKRLQRESRAPILDLRRAVKKRLSQEGVRRVSVLGTKTTMQSKLYEYENIGYVHVKEQDVQGLMNAIRAYNSGKAKERQEAIVKRVVDELHARGAERVILACTEFALMHERVGGRTIDTIQVLVEETVKEYAQRR